jgi:hypothetical protein
MDNDADRVERIREYGKLEMDIEQQKKENPAAEVKRDEIIKQHPTDYPHLQTPRDEIAKPAEPVPSPTPQKREEKVSHQKTKQAEYKYVPHDKSPVIPKSQPQKPPVQVKPQPKQPAPSAPIPVPQKEQRKAIRKK